MFCTTKDKYLENELAKQQCSDDQPAILISPSLSSESGKKKNIMLTDAEGNISVVKFDELINSINMLAAAVNKNTLNLASLSASAIGNGDTINIVAKSGLFLNNCGSDPNAPCLDTKGGTAHYVSTYNNNASGNQWTIKKP
tara:strand:- start:39 stop:461 length:423 start_codon:yes stop_codon:yes gene_type:complete